MEAQELVVKELVVGDVVRCSYKYRNIFKEKGVPTTLGVIEGVNSEKKTYKVNYSGKTYEISGNCLLSGFSNANNL